MILKRIRYANGKTSDSDVAISRIEFETEEGRYVITEGHEGFFRIRKSEETIRIEPGCSNEILIK